MKRIFFCKWVMVVSFVILVIVFVGNVEYDQILVWKVLKGDDVVYVGGIIYILLIFEFLLFVMFIEIYEKSDILVFEVKMFVLMDIEGQ